MYYNKQFIYQHILHLWCFYQFPRASVKVPQTGGLEQVYFLTILEARSLRKRCPQRRFLSLASRLSSSHCVLTWSFSVCEHICVQISSYQTTSHIGLGPTLFTSFQLSFLFKIQSSSEVLGVKTSTYEFGGDTIQPITVFSCFHLG